MNYAFKQHYSKSDKSNIEATYLHSKNDFQKWVFLRIWNIHQVLISSVVSKTVTSSSIAKMVVTSQHTSPNLSSSKREGSALWIHVFHNTRTNHNAFFWLYRLKVTMAILDEKDEVNSLQLFTNIVIDKYITTCSDNFQTKICTFFFPCSISKILILVSGGFVDMLVFRLIEVDCYRRLLI